MPRKRDTFDEDQVQKALGEIRNGQISKKAAAKKYIVPRSTLQFRLGSHFSKARPGPPTILTEEEEQRIVEWIKISQQKGFPKRNEDVVTAVKEFLEDTDRPHPFGENKIPGKGWFKAFLKRHPSLSLRATDPVSAASATVAASDIYSWFDTIENFLKDHDYYDILEDPTRIFNGDETNFLLCPKTKNVLAAKGSRNVYEIDKGLAKANLTVMFTFSAAGVLTPPMIIYPYKRIPEEIRKSLPKGWGIGISDNGWMTKQVFYEYISKVLHPYLVQLGTKFPVIYFVDGHSTHLTLPVSELCVKLQIILVALYPNATRILQPADVAAFKPLKMSWNRKVLEWRRNNPSASLTKEKFAPLLYDVVESTVCKETIQKGFKACGLFPFNKFAINLSKCLGRSSSKSTYGSRLNPKLPDDGFQTLCEAIGDNKIQLFESIDRGELQKDSFNEDFVILYDLYNKFKSKGKLNLSVSDKSTQTHVEYQNIETSEIDISAIDEFFIIQDPPSTANDEIINISNVIPIQQSTELQTVTYITVPPQSTTAIIDDFLPWPETPLRKGCKTDKIKKPYVVTSPLWIKQEQLKKDQLKKIELEKENRKILRMKNKELKNAEKLNKTKRPRKENAKSKKSSSTTTSTNVLVAIENTGQSSIEGNRDMRICEQLNCHSNNKSFLVETPDFNEPIVEPIIKLNEMDESSGSYQSTTNTTTSSSVEPIKDTLQKFEQIQKLQSIKNDQNEFLGKTIPHETIVKPFLKNKEIRKEDGTGSKHILSTSNRVSIISEPPKDHHVRKLFCTDVVLDIGDNSPAAGKMCYHCTYAFTGNSGSENFGIKCQSCTREFHLKCLIKLKIQYNPRLICNGCKIL